MLFTRLATFYFAFFALLGLVVPFWAPYLESIGMSAVEIGWLLGAFHLSRLYAPNIWGYLADHYGHRLMIVRLGSLGGLLTVMLLPGQTVFLTLWLCMLTFSFFWNAILPQFEVITLQHLAKRSNEYGRIRLWGSVGFIVTVLLGGQLFIGDGIAGLPYSFALVMFLILLASFWVPDVKTVKSSEKPPAGLIRQAMKRPEVIRFLLMIFFVQMAHGPYNGFYTLLLQQEGYGGTAIGWLWTIGVLAEILLFAKLHRLWSSMGFEWVLLASLLLGSLRWLMLAFMPDQLWVLVVAQLLHAASFAVVLASGIRLVQELFPAGAEGRGQAIHSSIGFGLGGVVGSIAAGYLWDHLGPQASFIFAAVASLIAFWLALGQQFLGKVQQSSEN